MDTVNNSSKTYPVTPGQRYAFAFICLAPGDVNLYWSGGDAGQALFKRPDGTTTSWTGQNAEESDGAEVTSPSTHLHVEASGEFSCSLVPIL